MIKPPLNGSDVSVAGRGADIFVTQDTRVIQDTRVALSHFQVALYRLSLTARDYLHLPPYKGSTLRGGFGTVFRRVCCTLRDRECKGCMLHATCPYGYIFETAPPPGAEKLRVLDNIPRPFVLEPPLETKTEYAPGESLEFGLVLVGRAVEFFPYFVVTFRELGEVGIGRGRGRYRLSKIRAVHPWRGEQEEVFDGDSALVKNSRLLVTAEGLRQQVERLRGACSLSLKLITMARLKYEDDLTERLEFHVLVRALLRRLSTLSYFHHGVALELDFRGLIERAEGIRLVRHQTRWVDWERYSRRQDRRMTLGGLVGEVTYEAAHEGDLDPYLPLLLWGELVHVGKNATFGLGQYRIERPAVLSDPSTACNPKQTNQAGEATRQEYGKRGRCSTCHTLDLEAPGRMRSKGDSGVHSLVGDYIRRRASLQEGK